MITCTTRICHSKFQFRFPAHVLRIYIGGRLACIWQQSSQSSVWNGQFLLTNPKKSSRPSHSFSLFAGFLYTFICKVYVCRKKSIVRFFFIVSPAVWNGTHYTRARIEISLKGKRLGRVSTPPVWQKEVLFRLVQKLTRPGIIFEYI